MLRLFLRDDLRDEVTGDLHEMYKDILKERSKPVAKIIIWYEALNYIRPFAIKKKKHPNTVNPLAMYKSYLRTAIRNMVKNKMHAALNILGLSVGITVTFVIALWIADELSYEKHFENRDRIGRVIQNVINNDKVQTWTNIPWPLGDELRKNYGTDFKRIAMSTDIGSEKLQRDSVKFDKPGLFAEPGLLEMLAPKMIYGSVNSASDPSSILLSKSTSVAFFGDANPVGETIIVDETNSLKVGGVYEDISSHSDFAEMHFIGSWELYHRIANLNGMEDPWRPNGFKLYVELNENANFADASARIKDAKMKRISEALQKKKPALFIHPMNEWHLKAQFVEGKQTGGRMQYVWLFGVVAVFVLLMACINFMNLSTARSEKRAKEVGIRKAIGSLRSQLINQFLAESIITVFIALAIAFILTQISLPFFNLISEKQMALPWGDGVSWIVCISIALLVGVIAGSYPALYLSGMGFQKITRTSKSSSILRKGLVMVQFTVSVVLIIGTAVVYLQIQHAKNRPIGYNADGLMTMWLSKDLHTHFDAIRTDLKSNGAIVDMTEAAAPPTMSYASSSQFEWKGKDPNVSVDFPFFYVFPNYGKTINWNVLQGRDFEENRIADSSAMILNKAAAEFIGLKEPIGEIMRWGGVPFEIVGIVDNLVVTSPYANPVPMVYVASTDRQNSLILRLNPEKSATESLALIEPVYKKYVPERNFEYQFTDVVFARKFGNEERVGTLATTFACLAIFISCLGIFGLSSFTAEQRTKELGVRKVLGASIFDLWSMMSKDFVLLAVISCVIAMPIAYFLLNDWLENFAYHLGVPIWTFGAATAATLLITLVTVSWHTLSAAGTNPVKSLRTE